jgi:hypothetical protein
MDLLIKSGPFAEPEEIREAPSSLEHVARP